MFIALPNHINQINNMLMYQFQKFPATVSCKMFFEKKIAWEKKKRPEDIPRLPPSYNFFIGGDKMKEKEKEKTVLHLQ